MNNNWQEFLCAQHLLTNPETDKPIGASENSQPSAVYPLPQLGILGLSGPDAAKLLQGQTTCNIDDITENQASIGALCNAKGRVISSFFIVKRSQQLLLILPAELVDLVKKRLQLYILRSDVKLSDESEQLCLFGFLAVQQHME